MNDPWSFFSMFGYISQRDTTSPLCLRELHACIQPETCQKGKNERSIYFDDSCPCFGYSGQRETTRPLRLGKQHTTSPKIIRFTLLQCYATIPDIGTVALHNGLPSYSTCRPLAAQYTQAMRSTMIDVHFNAIPSQMVCTKIAPQNMNCGESTWYAPGENVIGSLNVMFQFSLCE